MKVARGVILGVLLAAYSVAGVGNAVAQNLCPYDTTGDYTYDPAASPTYLFFGDGQITYDGSLPWYMDDTLACYNVYKTPGYLPYFPKCDLDGDGQVAISEVYDIYYRVHPVAQGDAIAQAACVEAFAGGPFFFCHPWRYNRTVTDIQAIVAAYPAAEVIVADEPDSLGHVPEGYTFDALRCENLVGFPPGAFGQLNECYLANESPLPGTSIVFIDFADSVDVTNALGEYSDVAQNYGGICMPLLSGSLPGTTPGFHYIKYDDQGWWRWNVRATQQCVDDTCRCDVRYELWTHKDYPGEVWLNAETVNNNDCTDLRFVDCDTTIDADGDGTPDCIDLCPTDPAKSEPGGCGCGNPDTDTNGNGIPDCLDYCYPDSDSDGDGVCDQDDPCPNDPTNTCVPPCWYYGGDSDGDGICDDVDRCPHDPNKYDPGMCGCGVGDYDSNGNGIADCLEECIHGDPSKTQPGVCGCHEPDIDDDGDGVYTCQGDLCDNDPDKTEPGECGCGQPEGTCPTCDDIAGTDWGSCASPYPLGFAVIDGACEVIIGCEIPAGVSLFASNTECLANCGCCASNADCGADEYCKFPEGECGPAGCGSCELRPDVCIQIYEPVCGCDGQTHYSECGASIHGVSVYYPGECAP